MLSGLMPPQARAQGTIDLPAANRTAGAATEASGWPAKPVRLVVPLPAGGHVDGFAAPLAAALSKELGQPVVLDHRPGVGGNLGAEIVARSAADGYTFLLGSVDQAIAAASAAGLSYDLQQDLAPVTLLAVAPVVVVVDAARPALGAIADLVRVRHAHSAGPAASYASAGDGSLSHLAAARFHQATGGGTGHRAIRGAATALADLQAGHADYLFAPLNAVLPAIREGRVRALAVSGAARSFSLPAVPRWQRRASAACPSWPGTHCGRRRARPPPSTGQCSGASQRCWTSNGWSTSGIAWVRNGAARRRTSSP